MSGMTVNARNPGEDMTTTPPQRIGGWLLGPLAAVSRVVERLAGVITLRYGACHTANVQDA